MPHKYYTALPGRSFLLLATLFLLWIQPTHAAHLAFGWDPSSDPNVAGYSLYYGTTPGQYTQILNAGSSTSATVTSLTPGTTYYFAVTAYNSIGMESLPSNVISLTVPDNIPPSVSLTSPSAGNSFSPGSSIALTAAASDSDGTIVKVEFYQDTNKIGESTSAPYSAMWSNATVGNFVLTALAYDDAGYAVRSAGVPVAVVSPPTPETPDTPVTPAGDAPEPQIPGLQSRVGKVRVTAVTPLIKGGAVAQFLLVCSQADPAQPTMVNYSLGGTATPGVHYSMDNVTGQVMIPPGGRGALVPLETMPMMKGRKTIALTVMPGSGYTPGRGTAVVKIISH